MALFDKVKEPVFLKDDSEADRQLASLQALRGKATDELADKLDEEINRVNAGIFGEKTVRFEPIYQCTSCMICFLSTTA